MTSRQSRPAAGTALSAGQRRAVDAARNLAAAAEDGQDAVAALLGCPAGDDVHRLAFAAAMDQIPALIAIIDELADRARCELKEWSTTKELCAWLGIDLPTLYYLNGRGEGPRRHRAGKTYRYRRGDVEKWLEARAAD